MARTKEIKGQYAGKGRIQIVDHNGVRLPDGQKVLVYKPTDKEIVGYLSGRTLGKKEKVLGAGTIKTIDGKAYVITHNKSSTQARMGLACPKNIEIKGVMKPNARFVIRNKKAQPAEVLIKLIDE